MKKVFLVVMICVMGIIGFVAFKFMNENERRISPQATVTYKADELDLKIEYSRPYKKGREIFGGLVPYNQYWRTGADEATEITFGKEVTFGGEQVRPGSYRLYSIPGEEQWTVVLNSELGQWGAFEPNNDMDVVRIETSPSKLNQTVEQLTINFNEAKSGVDLEIAWDNLKVEVPIR